jgi:hypothetical protein
MEAAPSSGPVKTGSSGRLLTRPKAKRPVGDLSPEIVIDDRLRKKLTGRLERMRYKKQK